MFQIHQHMNDGRLEQMTVQDPDKAIASAYPSPRAFMAGCRECYAIKIDDPRRPVYRWNGRRFVAPDNLR